MARRLAALGRRLLDVLTSAVEGALGECPDPRCNGRSYCRAMQLAEPCPYYLDNR